MSVPSRFESSDAVPRVGLVGELAAPALDVAVAALVLEAELAARLPLALVRRLAAGPAEPEPSLDDGRQATPLGALTPRRAAAVARAFDVLVPLDAVGRAAVADVDLPLCAPPPRLGLLAPRAVPRGLREQRAEYLRLVRALPREPFVLGGDVPVPGGAVDAVAALAAAAGYAGASAALADAAVALAGGEPQAVAALDDALDELATLAAGRRPAVEDPAAVRRALAELLAADEARRERLEAERRWYATRVRELEEQVTSLQAAPQRRRWPWPW